MSRAPTPSSCSPTATSFEGEAIGAIRTRRRRHGRGRVQHGAVGLPGDPHRPVVRRADDHVHVPAHRELRRERATTSRAAGRSAAVSSCATSRAARAAGARRATSIGSCVGTASPASSGIDTRRLTRHLREHGALPGAFGTDEAAVRRPRRRGDGTDGHRPRRRGHDRRAVRRRRRRRAVLGRRVRLRDQAHDPAPPRRCRAVGSRSCRRRRPRRRRARRASRMACSSRTGPATPRPSSGAVDAVRALLGEVPVFGICLGHQILGPRARRREAQAARSGTTAPTTRSGTRPPAASRSPARTTTTRSGSTRVPGGAELTHVNLNDGVVEGFRVGGTPRVRRPAPPRGRSGPHDAVVPVRRVHRA